MKVPFSKYHGAGNDFILIDNREKKWHLSTSQIALACHRRFGIGADGLMLLEKETGYDFRMVYYNADGGLSSMCGNGGRCLAVFAHRLGIGRGQLRFMAFDGPHQATVRLNGHQVALSMRDVQQIIFENENIILMDTGSPHLVMITKAVESIDVYTEGKKIRESEPYKAEGINVNFVEKTDQGILVRTYERGVEAETLSCGTGVTASAIASVAKGRGTFLINVRTPGGELSVSFQKETTDSAHQIILTGPVQHVCDGEWSLP